MVGWARWPPQMEHWLGGGRCPFKVTAFKVTSNFLGHSGNFWGHSVDPAREKVNKVMGRIFGPMRSAHVSAIFQVLLRFFWFTNIRVVGWFYNLIRTKVCYCIVCHNWICSNGDWTKSQNPSTPNARILHCKLSCLLQAKGGKIQMLLFCCRVFRQSKWSQQRARWNFQSVFPQSKKVGRKWVNCSI